MSIDYNALTLNDNIQEHRFEMPVGKHIAFLEYQEKLPLEIGFSYRQVVFNSLFLKRYAWSYI